MLFSSTCRRQSASLARRPRRAFTLVEVLIAVALINVGVLSLIAVTAVVVRQTARVRGERMALEAASRRIEMLAAGACVATAGFAAGPWGTREQWSVELVAVGAREISDSVEFDERRSGRAVVLRTRLPC